MTEPVPENTEPEWKVAHAELRAEIAEFKHDMNRPIHTLDLRVADQETESASIRSEMRLHREVILLLLAGMAGLCWRAFA